MLVFSTNLSLTEFQVRCLVLFCLFSVTHSFGWFWMGVPQGSILGATLFLLYINNLPNSICIIVINAGDTTLYSFLELVSELESDLRDTMDWGKKWLVDFSAEKAQLFSFD